ncbi:hypothetical protein HNR42_002604 [Deinobacterium chartae]|uniref:DUF4388 domain-containing protein n=1 Tax=Deinobacterium chartae TaxID=521158 RepID=A0A841I444_9DEIO|nr:DUF4388 domain-containing protein [Deinobacterium chartae]MBB6099168.1 hypothetical protein [Deinobacterium chartae]
MAIFGNLNDLPLPEVLAMLGRRSGRLEVWQVAGRHRFELHLEQDTLTALVLDGQPLTDTLHVRHHFLDLAAAEIGVFEFNRSEALRRDVCLPVQNLLLSTTAVIDELDHYRAQLGSPDTRYALRGTLLPLGDPLLDDFARASAPLLERGASAREVAGQLLLSVDQVQLDLYKLRTLGRVIPLRSTQPSPGREHSPGLIARLLGALGLGVRT